MCIDLDGRSPGVRNLFSSNHAPKRLRVKRILAAAKITRLSNGDLFLGTWESYEYVFQITQMPLHFNKAVSRKNQGYLNEIIRPLGD
jgi:hypothetical protein